MRGTEGTGCGVGRRFEEENKLSADAVAGCELSADFGDCAAQEFFVELGEFACGNDAESGSEDGFDIGESVGQAMRGFVENEGFSGVAGLRSDVFEPGAAGGGLFGGGGQEKEIMGGG